MKLLINLKVIEKQIWILHLTQTIFYTNLVSSFDYLRWKKMFCEKVVLRAKDNTTLDVIQFIFCLVFVVIIRSKEP